MNHCSCLLFLLCFQDVHPLDQRVEGNVAVEAEACVGTSHMGLGVWSWLYIKEITPTPAWASHNKDNNELTPFSGLLS